MVANSQSSIGRTYSIYEVYCTNNGRQPFAKRSPPFAGPSTAFQNPSGSIAAEPTPLTGISGLLPRLQAGLSCQSDKNAHVSHYGHPTLSGDCGMGNHSLLNSSSFSYCACRYIIILYESISSGSSSSKRRKPWLSCIFALILLLLRTSLTLSQSPRSREGVYDDFVVLKTPLGVLRIHILLKLTMRG
jgi:hypothetical protein